MRCEEEKTREEEAERNERLTGSDRALRQKSKRVESRADRPDSKQQMQNRKQSSSMRVNQTDYGQRQAPSGPTKLLYKRKAYSAPRNRQSSPQAPDTWSGQRI